MPVRSDCSVISSATQQWISKQKSALCRRKLPCTKILGMALDYYAVQTLLQVLILGALFGITGLCHHLSGHHSPGDAGRVLLAEKFYARNTGKGRQFPAHI